MTLNRPSVSVLAALAGGLPCAAIAQSAADGPDPQTRQPIPQARNFAGLGVGLLPATAGSRELRAMVLPIVQASWRDKLYINALRAGVWLVDSADRGLRLGLAAEPRFGWDADDGDRTRGMADRDTSFEAGPALRWQTGWGTFNATYAFDLGGASDGRTAQLQFIRALRRGPGLRLNGVVGLQWSDAKLNDYYYGVRPGEAAPGRPAYSAGAGTQLQVGLNGAWPVGQGRSVVLFGANASRLSDAQAASPIVERRIQPVVYFGYAWGF